MKAGNLNVNEDQKFSCFKKYNKADNLFATGSLEIQMISIQKLIHSRSNPKILSLPKMVTFYTKQKLYMCVHLNYSNIYFETFLFITWKQLFEAFE
jgi:hypothetical protein